MPTSSDQRPSVEVRGLGKRYLLGDVARDGDLARWLRRLAGAPWRWLRGRAHDGEPATLWALRDLDLDVAPGEVLGIVGANGAGKSTLLRLLALITEPTEGRFTLRGRTASLLEVGTGFHWELTGRENVYLSGTLLGMRKKEIDRRFDDIVAFAGVEEHIDTPVKRYSSGMYVRLGFAVAAHLAAEILLVDEVLAVGDAAFRRKCVGTMGDVARSGRTVLFVSHDMSSIQQLCDRAILLDEGRITADGSPRDVVRTYLHVEARPRFEADACGDHPCVTCVALEDEVGRRLTRPVPSDVICIRVSYAVPRRDPGLRMALALLADDGRTIFESDSQRQGFVLPAEAGEHEVRLAIPGGVLLPGDHHVGIRITDAAGYELDRRAPAVSFVILPGPDDAGTDHGLIRSPAQWTSWGDGGGCRG